MFDGLEFETWIYTALGIVGGSYLLRFFLNGRLFTRLWLGCASALRDRYRLSDADNIPASMYMALPAVALVWMSQAKYTGAIMSTLCSVLGILGITLTWTVGRKSLSLGAKGGVTFVAVFLVIIGPIVAAGAYAYRSYRKKQLMKRMLEGVALDRFETGSRTESEALSLFGDL